MTTQPYGTSEPTRAEIDQSQGVVLLEFGADWCSICQAAQPNIASALNDRAGIEHIKVGDGKGKPLGRSFQVKLWPTLIALRDGKEVGRLVRPTTRQAISQLLDSTTPTPAQTL